MVNIDNNPDNADQTDTSQTTLGMILPSTTKTEIKKTFQLIVRAEFAIYKRSTTPFNQYAHVKGLLTMMKTKGKAEVIVHSINDPKKTFKEMKDFPPDEEKFDAFFSYAKATAKGTPKRMYVVMKMTSDKTLKDMKRNQVFFSYLTESKVFITDHKYGEDLTIVNLGIIMGRKTDYTWIDSIIIELREQLQADLEEKAQFGSMEDDGLIDKDMLPTIPPFDISSKQVYFNKAGDNEQYSTRALKIRCGGEDATKLNKMLMAMEVMDKRKGQFVPYGLGKSHPGKYSVQITENNKKSDQTMKINVFGIHNKIMEGIVDQYELYNNLRDLILAYNVDNENGGNHMVFQAIEETNFTETKGKYFFVYHEDMHEAAITFVDTTLPGLIKQGTEYPKVRKLENFRKVRKGGRMEHYDGYADRLPSSVTKTERARITIALPAAANAANMEIIQSFLIQLRIIHLSNRERTHRLPRGIIGSQRPKKQTMCPKSVGQRKPRQKQERQASQ